ncbi:C40 family peptidase [Streptomyces reniochalinae]|uniref:Peptidoglycan endopeptidase n=1 Tax=Streptomyces reniochalinae TaxID=2250578 RepID=A0A367E5V7_9ACTN|nr:C40 family peptidase [Streptomyces reniochalinae]RCG13446.1 peptidoglycan endopeptidase [Streptomyces reniochalinae]
MSALASALASSAVVVPVLVALGLVAPPVFGAVPEAGVRVPGTPAPGPEPGPPGAGRKSVGELLGELSVLYQRTEEASEAYNQTAEKLKKQRASSRKAQSRLARARTALERERARAGELARQQYRGESVGLPPAVEMLLSSDPERLLEHGHFLRRAAGTQAETVRRVTDGRQRHAAAAQRAGAAVKRQEGLTERKKKQRDEVRKRLRSVEKLLSSLTGDQLTQLHALERDRTDAAQQQLVSSGALDPSGAVRHSSDQGRRALDWAMDQVGKPYVWGAEGPKSFDCSGLTSQAWRHAGRTIPRTSQEQWRRLPRVPLDELRPGDLVIYHRGATHVGMYAGAGRVVQAPRPGADVQVTPLATDPPLGAVRPDKRRT